MGALWDQITAAHPCSFPSIPGIVPLRIEGAILEVDEDTGEVAALLFCAPVDEDEEGE